MTREHFTIRLQEELLRLQARFHYADLVAFIAERWPAIEKDPDPERWARAFLDGGKASVVV